MVRAETRPYREAYDDAVFIKVGEYSNRHLIWYTKRSGFFVTDRNGNGFNGDYRVPYEKVERTLATI